MTDTTRKGVRAKATKAPARAAAAKPAKAPAKQDKPLTPSQRFDAEGIEAICRRIEDGESLTGIAHSFGTGLSVLQHWLAADVGRSARARESRARAAAAYDEQAQREIQMAADPFELARAKELAHHLRWRASKVNPREYGDKVDVTQNVTVRDVSDDELQRRLSALGVAGLSLPALGFNKPQDAAE